MITASGLTNSVVGVGYSFLHAEKDMVINSKNKIMHQVFFTTITPYLHYGILVVKWCKNSVNYMGPKLTHAEGGCNIESFMLQYKYYLIKDGVL